MPFSQDQSTRAHREMPLLTGRLRKMALENDTTPKTQRTRRLGVDADHPHYKWWALSCTSLGMLLATINSGTLIIALPDLERSLHTTSSRSSG